MSSYEETLSDYVVPLPEDAKTKINHNLIMLQSQQLAVVKSMLMQQSKQVEQLQQVIMQTNQTQAVAKSKEEN